MADTAEEFQALVSRHAASFLLLFLLLFSLLHFPDVGASQPEY